ncbi:hypothetical protein BRM3_08920 [Brachybacterium huguangmaarense]|uniref:HK97 gp10 family phage protein n=1 Tax=Brachybacterium huguangmaarense TaxID=1652028 RepID=A0ABY6FZF5_9MICO|nr:hypothetical protein [Brachybacterium huguangmaarense]UYG15766.1 hypothetical protein BRM3_08920 [Brachybacterium huguangmaarense]
MELDTRRIIQEAVQTPAVRRSIHLRASRIASRAKALAARQGLPEFAASIDVVDGVRPGTKARGFRRPYSRVVARHDKANEIERGGGRYGKSRILARAARATR